MVATELPSDTERIDAISNTEATITDHTLGKVFRTGVIATAGAVIEILVVMEGVVTRAGLEVGIAVQLTVGRTRIAAERTGRFIVR
jgi:hypothetical protein